jgi:hypothetical protein
METAKSPALARPSTCQVSDVELAGLTVPDCPAFGRFEETEKSDPTCRPTEALTPPRRQDRRSEKPEKSHKPGAWPDQDVDVTENVLGAGKIEDVEFCQKSFLLTFSKNWMINFELLKKSLKKVDQQNLNHADQVPFLLTFPKNLTTRF